MRLKAERVRVTTRCELLAPRVRSPRFLPLSIPRTLALRLRERFERFERSAATPVERETRA
jgi:hypothetical protein